MTNTTTTDPATGAPLSPGEAERRIAADRRLIDDLDARLVALVRERMAVSERVQRARIAAGGRRVHLARENEILRRYRAELGEPGTRLAMTLLELCRGRA
jgi:chorismate mutase